MKSKTNAELLADLEVVATDRGISPARIARRTAIVLAEKNLIAATMEYLDYRVPVTMTMRQARKFTERNGALFDMIEQRGRELREARKAYDRYYKPGALKRSKR